jgi:restriction endonuclease Mrr
MAVLDDLSGFEFEDVMEDVFRNLGYENVRQAERTADEGRDVTMEEVVDGTQRAIVVECKHTGTVGRPVVQKLHSAIATYEFDGPKRGMVATTGRFTGPAQEYAQRLRQHDDPYPIELLDGTGLREIADEIGLDLYNGRIEILCDETLRPYGPATDITRPVNEAFREIENIDTADLPTPHSAVTFRPVVAVVADTDAVFQTSVGVIHRIDTQNQLVFHAERGEPHAIDSDLASLVTENLHATVTLDTPQLTEVFDELDERRFGQTQTEYKDWAVDQLTQHHETTVTYTGGNNVTYNKTCEPTRSDISIQSLDSVYLPEIRHAIEIQEYTYEYQSYAAGPSRVTGEDGIRRCVHCETSGTGTTYTFCPNCGAIACHTHTNVERLENEPICTGCAVTDRFALRTKYFYDETNLETFREEYAEMPLYRKALENTALAGGSVVVTLLVLFGLLVLLL